MSIVRFPSSLNCYEHAKVVDEIENFYVCVVNNDRFEYKNKDEFITSAGLFHNGENGHVQRN